MCLALFSPEYFTLALLSESVFLDLHHGKVRAREVYDVFLRPRRDWDRPRITCISPHDLISTGELRVNVVSVPGVRTQDEVVYAPGIGYGSNYDTKTSTFSVVLPLVVAGRSGYQPQTEPFSGVVLTPRAQVPEKLGPAARSLMTTCGTVFELLFDEKLKAGKEYMFRLEVSPANLLGLSSPRGLRETTVEPVQARWVQNATVFCTKTCRFNLRDSLENLKQDPEFAQGATEILSIVDSVSLFTIPAERHRIVLVLPHWAEAPHECVGNTWWLGQHQLPDGRLAEEWGAGTREYGTDDPEPLAKQVYEYIESWAPAEPKKKEDATTALGASHDNCSLIVDALCRMGALKCVDTVRGLYQALPLHGNARQEAFESVAKDPAVIKGFKWKGSEIRFALNYHFLSEQDASRLDRARLRNQVVLWLAVAGTVLAIIALVLTVCLR